MSRSWSGSDMQAALMPQVSPSLETGTPSSATLFPFLTQEKQRAVDIPKAYRSPHHSTKVTAGAVQLSSPRMRGQTAEIPALQTYFSSRATLDPPCPGLWAKRTDRQQRKSHQKQSTIWQSMKHGQGEARRRSPVVCDPKETIRALKSEVPFTGGVLHSGHTSSGWDEDTKNCHL